MKTKFSQKLFALIITTGFFTTGFAQANKFLSDPANASLSNLIAPTAINVDLLPNANNGLNLGSLSMSWKNIYTDGSIYLHDVKFISTSNAVGSTFLGAEAGNSNTGPNNTGVGYQALYSNTTGFGNTATGLYALYFNDTAIYNTANGDHALYSNTSGNKNTTNGYGALYSNTTGRYNTANGAGALYSNEGGRNNTANGISALNSNTSGRNNTADGAFAGDFNDANTNCTFLGYDADQDVLTNFTNSMALGSHSRITASNQVRVGNILVNSIGGYEGWTILSDGRMKKNIKNNVPGLQFINLLKPITYNVDANSVADFLGEGKRADIKDAEGKAIVLNDDEAERKLIQQGRDEKSKIVYTGFTAQEVEAAASKIGYDFSGVDKPQNENSLYGLRYDEFVVPLVKAVQELSKMNDEKDLQLTAQKKINADLQKQIDELRAMIVSRQSAVSSEQSVVSYGSLSQNIPNPFNNTTTINYYLPKQSRIAGSAKIIIRDKNGSALKQINLSSNKGSVSVNAATLSSGAYQYSLYVNGRLIDTKQMILTK